MVFPWKMCCHGGWIAICRLNDLFFSPTSSGGTSGCLGMGCSPVVVASPCRLVSLFRQKNTQINVWLYIISALVAMTSEVISFRKKKNKYFIKTHLPINFGRMGCVSDEVGPGFAQVSVCAGRDSGAAGEWDLPFTWELNEFWGTRGLIRGNWFSPWPCQGLIRSLWIKPWGAEP